MRNANASLIKLAIGIVSVSAIAGLAGQFSIAVADFAPVSNNVSTTQGGTIQNAAPQQPGFRLAQPQQTQPGAAAQQARRTRTKQS